MSGAAIAIEDAAAADTIRRVKERMFALNEHLPVLRQRLVYRPGPRGIKPLADNETLPWAARVWRRTGRPSSMCCWRNWKFIQRQGIALTGLVFHYTGHCAIQLNFSHCHVIWQTVRRIRKELKDLMNNPVPLISVEVDDCELSHWNVALGVRLAAFALWQRG
jgi:hypothetical protein